MVSRDTMMRFHAEFEHGGLTVKKGGGLEGDDPVWSNRSPRKEENPGTPGNEINVQLRFADARLAA